MRRMTLLDGFRLAVFLASLLPFGRLLWLGANDGLSANPLELVTRSTGTWALVFLCLSLSMTPLRRLTGQPFWMRLRRMLGLYCFFYALLHAGLWVWIDRGLDPQAMAHDVLKRPFITAGFFAFLLLIPLAATSTHAMMRRLGRRWQSLHRLVYLIAVAAILHYVWHKAGKNDFGTVGVYALVVAGLLGSRVWWALADRRRAAAARAHAGRRAP